MIGVFIENVIFARFKVMNVLKTTGNLCHNLNRCIIVEIDFVNIRGLGMILVDVRTDILFKMLLIKNYSKVRNYLSCKFIKVLSINVESTIGYEFYHF